MKKKVYIAILIVIIFNFIFNSFVIAVPETPTTPETEPSTGDTTSDDNNDSNGDDEDNKTSSYQKISMDGYEPIETSSGTVNKKIGSTESTVGSGAGILASLLVPFGAAIKESLLTDIAMSGRFMACR